MKKLIFVLILVCSYQAKANSNLEVSGDALHLLLPASALAATLFYEDDTKRDYSGTWQFAKAALSSRIVTEALKFSIDKQRPDHSGDDSFPSGHTADSFMAATFINQRYGWHYGVPALVLASYVGYTRVASDKHHIEDVLVGAAIGSVAGWFFTQPYKNITLTPMVNKDQYGLYLSGQF